MLRVQFIPVGVVDMKLFSAYPVESSVIAVPCSLLHDGSLLFPEVRC